jgi:phospholipid/cholesterol/gamma-HCH transport system substrate-binding protein
VIRVSAATSRRVSPTSWVNSYSPVAAKSSSGDLVATLAGVRGAAGQLEQRLGQLEQPVDDFAATGLYEFTQLVGETRLLVAALSRITKEFERDPTGFLIGRSSRGFRPE